MSDTVSDSESSVPASDPPAMPPVAARHEVVHELHGDRRVDAYNWLRDTDDPKTLAHLAAERAYYDAATASLGADAADLFAAMEARVAPAEASVAHRRHRHAYFTRTLPGAEYPQHCRVAASRPGPRRRLARRRRPRR